MSEMDGLSVFLGICAAVVVGLACWGSYALGYYGAASDCRHVGAFVYHDNVFTCGAKP